MSFQGIPNHVNEDKIKQKFVLFTLGNHLKVTNFVIYLSHNNKRHYHIQIEQNKIEKQELQGKFQILTRWDWTYSSPKNQSLRKAVIGPWIRKLRRAKNCIDLMIARDWPKKKKKTFRHRRKRFLSCTKKAKHLIKNYNISLETKNYKYKLFQLWKPRSSLLPNIWW